jgi:hypothetical protein
LTAAVLIAVGYRAWALGTSLSDFTHRSDFDTDYWIGGTYFYHLYFHDRDWTNPHWSTLPSYEYPPIGRYVLGLGFELQGMEVPDSIGGLCHFIREAAAALRTRLHEVMKDRPPAEMDRFRRLEGRLDDWERDIPPVPGVPFAQDYRMPAARTVFSFSLLATLVLILAAWRLSGSLLAAAIGGWLVLDNPNTIPAFQSILVDSIAAFFALAALVSSLMLQKELAGPARRGATLAKAAALGLLVGLAVGTKLIDAYVPLAVTSCAVLSLVVATRRGIATTPIRAPLAGLATVIVCAVGIFVLSNPLLHRDPLGGIETLVRYRLDMTDLLGTLRLDGVPVTGLANRLRVLLENGVLLGYPALGPGHRVAAVALSLGVALGVVVLIRGIVRELRDGLVGPQTTLGVWVLAVFGLNGSLLTVNWDRYLIPFSLFSILVSCVGLGSLLRRLVLPPGTVDGGRGRTMC